MLFRFGRWLVVVALVLSVGLHRAWLQPVAWVSMVVSYAQDTSLEKAVALTFDGKHPCRICHFVQKDQNTSQKTKLLKVESRLEFCLEARTVQFFPPTSFILSPGATMVLEPRAEGPPSPPPKAPRSLFGSAQPS